MIATPNIIDMTQHELAYLCGTHPKTSPSVATNIFTTKFLFLIYMNGSMIREGICNKKGLLSEVKWTKRDHTFVKYEICVACFQ